MAVLMAYVIWCPALAPILLIYMHSIVYQIRPTTQRCFVMSCGLATNISDDNWGRGPNIVKE